MVLPLGISTAAAGLFQKDFLNLPFPKEDAEKLDRTVVIWGGSSSVGSCAIQLAVAAGAEVVTTASPTNFEYVRKLGAGSVFDYHDEVPFLLLAINDVLVLMILYRTLKTKSSTP